MTLPHGSVLRPAVFLLSILLFQFFCPQVQAWNPDYAYGLPRQKRMCLSRQGNTVTLSSISLDESCPAGTQRYVVVFGREPRGSIGMLPISTSEKFYPPLILKWPGKEETTYDHLWHFTCVEPKEIDLLESKIQLMRYKGEITAKAGQDCLDAQHRALEYCQKEYQGSELLESCPLSWGIE